MYFNFSDPRLPTTPRMAGMLNVIIRIINQRKNTFKLINYFSRNI